MVSLPKKIIVTLFLVFIIFLVFNKPVGEKIEEKKRTDLEKICHQVSEESDNFYYLKETFNGYETFKLGGVSSFSATINKTLEFTKNTERKLADKEIPEEIKDFEKQCQTKLLTLGENLKKLKPNFDYLEKIYPIYKDLESSLKEAEEKKYPGFVDQVRKIKEYQKKIEQDLNILINLIPPEGFKESQLYLKKALSGLVDFWNNAEVAVVRKTPYIFNYSLWVSQNDWQQMEKAMIKELDSNAVGF